jgi:hypothetical protein
MLEIGISVFLVLAVGYWAILWIMGRRDDVLHGQFVDFEGEDELAPAIEVPSPVPTRAKLTQRARKAPIAAEPASDEAALQSLLASIKQELKIAAQI